MHPRIIYEIRNVIAYPLTKLSNKCLETNKMPAIWKCANISPIYKKGRKDEVSRPVSLTCVLCKLLESIIRDTRSSATAEKQRVSCPHEGGL